MSPEQPPASPIPSEGPPSRPVFKLIGCLTVLILTLGVGLLIALWMVTSGGLPREPLPMPPLKADVEAIALPEGWQQGGLAVTASADSWNQTLEDWIQQAISRGKLAPGSGARCQSSPDGSLSLRVSLGVPEDAEDQDYLKRGRFLNFTMTGEMVIDQGQVQSARLDEYSWGFIYTQQPGEIIEDEAAKKIIERILQQLLELNFLPGSIRSLNHSPGQLTLELAPAD